MRLSRRARLCVTFLASLALAAVAVPVASAVWISGAILHPSYGPSEPGEITDPRVDLGLAFEPVEIRTSDELTLRGWWIPAAQARTAIVAVHGHGGDRRALAALAPGLHAAGYSVLLFDLRGHGASDGGAPGLAFPNGWRDVVEVTGFLKRERGMERVAVAGHSLGATSAILAAGLSPSVDAVVAEASGTSLKDLLRSIDPLARLPDWWIRLIAGTTLLRCGAPLRSFFAADAGPLAVVDRIAPRPLLIVQGTADDTVPPSAGQALFARAAEPKELWMVPGMTHESAGRTHVALYTQKIVDFLTAHGLSPTGATPSMEASHAS